MKSEQEVKNILEKSINKHFENDYYVKEKEKNIIEKIMESEERHYQSFEEQVNNAISTSMNSRTGTLFEKVMSDVAIACGFKDLTESNLFTRKDKTRILKLTMPVTQHEKIMKIINDLILKIEDYEKYTDSAFFDTFINEAKSDLTKTCLDITYNNDKNVESYECSFDFCMLSPEWLGNQFILVQELKYGGQLDLKKAISERRSLLKGFAFMTILHAEKIRSGNLFIESRFGIINEKKIKSGSVRKYFTSEEVKCGNDFWVSMCGYDLYKFSKKAMSEFRRKERKSEEAFEFINNIRNEVKEQFNKLDIPFSSSADEYQEIRSNLYSSYKREILQKELIEVQQKRINLQEDIMEEQQEKIKVLMSMLTPDQLAII